MSGFLDCLAATILGATFAAAVIAVVAGLIALAMQSPVWGGCLALIAAFVWAVRRLEA